MNTKTAKHLKKLAYEEAKEKGYPRQWAYRQLKKLWTETPTHQRHTLGL